MMKNGEDLKNIKAMMTVGEKSLRYGFKNGELGSLFQILCLMAFL